MAEKTDTPLITREMMRNRIHKWHNILSGILGVTVERIENFEDKSIFSVKIPVSLKEIANVDPYSFSIDFLTNGTTRVDVIPEDNPAYLDLLTWRNKNFPVLSRDVDNTWEKGYEDIVAWMTYLCSLVPDPPPEPTV